MAMLVSRLAETLNVKLYDKTPNGKLFNCAAAAAVA
jgi:hypothetical protein